MDRTMRCDRPAQERLEEMRQLIADQLEKIRQINAGDTAIDRACVELATLHSLFARKHTIMRAMRAKRVDLDRFDRREEGKECTG